MIKVLATTVTGKKGKVLKEGDIIKEEVFADKALEMLKKASLVKVATDSEIKAFKTKKNKK